MEWSDRFKEEETEIPSARQNFSRLRQFYENMLGRSNPDDITATDLVNCWFIAGVDMDRLKVREQFGAWHILGWGIYFISRNSRFDD